MFGAGKVLTLGPSFGGKEGILILIKVIGIVNVSLLPVVRYF